MGNGVLVHDKSVIKRPELLFERPPIDGSTTSSGVPQTDMNGPPVRCSTVPLKWKEHLKANDLTSNKSSAAILV
jgi:hypothetical protein